MSRSSLIAICLALSGLAGNSAAALLGSAFTYQGELRVSGVPANGVYDLQFGLYGASTGGAPLVASLQIEDVPITNGIVSVPLDFGFTPFDGQALWLEIGIRTGNSTGGYQGLAPRQALSAAPYALHAVTAEMAQSVPEHDHIGERWIGSDDGYLLDITNTNTGYGNALRVGGSGTGPALYGINNPTTGTGAGVEGATNGTGPGVKAYSRLGAALRANSFSSGNIIEAYSGHPDTPNLRFRVTTAGNVFAHGNFTGGGADVAEFIDHHGELLPGDVIGIAADGRFELVQAAESTAVAGVVTTDPGLLMNADEARSTVDDAPALALAGRVPVKASAEGGAIRPGDLLVSAATPGHAMRAPDSPRPGTVIGKSLGTLEQGEGLVEMLVMLR